MADNTRKGLSRDQLQAAFIRGDRAYEYVDVPEWGGQIKLRVMSGLEAEAFMDATKARKERGESSMYALIAGCACDEDGNLLFPDESVLKSCSLRVLNRIQKAALKLQGFREEDAEEAKNG